jgi:hypothetical protein
MLLLLQPQCIGKIPSSSVVRNLCNSGGFQNNAAQMHLTEAVSRPEGH